MWALQPGQRTPDASRIPFVSVSLADLVSFRLVRLVGATADALHRFQPLGRRPATPQKPLSVVLAKQLHQLSPPGELDGFAGSGHGVALISSPAPQFPHARLRPPELPCNQQGQKHLGINAWITLVGHLDHLLGGAHHPVRRALGDPNSQGNLPEALPFGP